MELIADALRRSENIGHVCSFLFVPLQQHQKPWKGTGVIRPVVVIVVVRLQEGVPTLPPLRLAILLPQPQPSLHYLPAAGTNQLSVLRHSPDALPGSCEIFNDSILQSSLTEQDWAQSGSKYSENREVFSKNSQFSTFLKFSKPLVTLL